MGTIFFEFTTQQGNLSYTYTVSDNNMTRLVTYLRDKYSTIEGAAPDPIVVTPANTNVALGSATQAVVEQWKTSTLNYEREIEEANITVPPIIIT
jgi:hypothetical protein